MKGIYSLAIVGLLAACDNGGVDGNTALATPPPSAVSNAVPTAVSKSDPRVASCEGLKVSESNLQL
jgi:hypothetical protein